MALDRPLGVFDSGLGGLTVLRAVAHALPQESMIYFGDTARLPYGNKSQRTVTRLALEATRFLGHFDIKALVVACNSASALAIDAVRRECPVPTVGVVEAGARSAAGATRSGKIGVIGTRATVGSRCYERELEQIDASIQVVSAACPLFVPLVEEGWVERRETRSIVEDYLEPLREEGVDTLILGCTHYPLLEPVIQDVMGEGVRLVDSGEAVAAEVRALLEEAGLHRESAESPSHRFYVSDQPEQFEREGRRFLGDSPWGVVEPVDQSDVPWYDRWA